MNSVALNARQGRVCVPRFLGLYGLDLTDHNSVNHISSQEVSAGIYSRILQSLPKHGAKDHYA